MSATSRWSYTNVATVWPRGAQNDYEGGWDYGEPYAIKCTWTAKSEQRTGNGGEQFVSTVDFFHEDARVRYGDMIVKGDHSALAAPPLEARSIKGHTDWDMSFFNDPMPDYRSTT